MKMLSKLLGMIITGNDNIEQKRAEVDTKACTCHSVLREQSQLPNWLFYDEKRDSDALRY